jgi:hypothetical protein
MAEGPCPNITYVLVRIGSRDMGNSLICDLRRDACLTADIASMWHLPLLALLLRVDGRFHRESGVGCGKLDDKVILIKRTSHQLDSLLQLDAESKIDDRLYC